MIRENICLAAVFVVEALIAWLYFAYLFNRKRSKTFLLCSFFVGYSLFLPFRCSRLRRQSSARTVQCTRGCRLFCREAD